MHYNLLLICRKLKIVTKTMMKMATMTKIMKTRKPMIAMRTMERKVTKKKVKKMRKIH